jgi:glycosyltransferase involved in cell wall biosynthesis
MATACIHTLEPLEHGGVIAKVREVESLLQHYQHDLKLLYTATEQVPTTNTADKIKYFLRARPQWETSCGFRGFAIPHYPLPLWLTYALPTLFAAPLIQNSEMHLAVSGSSHVALPAALLRKQFIVWIGTLYEEEIQGKAIAGDKWAQDLLKSFAWKMLLREEETIFRRAALILTNGQHTADAVSLKHPAVAHKVRVVIYPVDTELFKPALTLTKNDSPYLLFTARINDSRKNVGMLFKAFAQVRTRFPNLKLILTGNQPDESVKLALRQANLEDAVEFVGYQTRENLIKLYQNAEVFVLSSSQEGLGISMLEALACGLPVVSTKCGGPESVITSGDNGILVANDNATALADGTELLANPARLAAMRIRCAEFARQTFSKHQVERKLLAALQTVYAEHFTRRTSSPQ